MAVTSCDFFICINASNHGETIDFTPGDQDAGYSGYFSDYYRALGARSANRKLALCAYCPSYLNSDPGNSELMILKITSAIANYAHGNQWTVGQLALLGSSNGSAIALGVAYDYVRIFNRPLAYVRLLDLPMFHGGRSIAVSQDVGDLAVANDPLPPDEESAFSMPPDPDLLGAYMGETFQFFASRTRAAMLDPRPKDKPKIKLRPLPARVKWNTYQIDGNHVKLKAAALYRWIWVSGVSDNGHVINEVHGVIDGDDWKDDMRNVKLPTDMNNWFGRNDDNYHTRCCTIENRYFTEAAAELARG